MTDQQPGMAKLPPLTPEQISQLVQGLNLPQGAAEKRPVVVMGDHEAAMAALLAASMAEPWVRDAKAHGPAVQAAVDRYMKVYSEMQQAPVVGNTCIVMRQGAMTAAIELYGSLVAEQQLRDGAVTSKKPPAGNSATKGFSVAAAYHTTLAKEYMVEETRLKRLFDEFGDNESLELAKVALDQAQAHLGYAQDMLWMAMGEKPQKIDDPFGEFAKTMARLLG